MALYFAHPTTPGAVAPAWSTGRSNVTLLDGNPGGSAFVKLGFYWRGQQGYQDRIRSRATAAPGFSRNQRDASDLYVPMRMKVATYSRSQAGGVTPSAAVGRLTARAASGSTSPVGSVTRGPGRAESGAVTPAGA